MARPRGGKFTEHASIPHATRYPLDLFEDCKGTAAMNEFSLATWFRHIARLGVGRKIDRVAGYEEGFAAGWAKSKALFQQGTESGE